MCTHVRPHSPPGRLTTRSTRSHARLTVGRKNRSLGGRLHTSVRTSILHVHVHVHVHVRMCMCMLRMFAHVHVHAVFAWML